jgi:hypothetical protein
MGLPLFLCAKKNHAYNITWLQEDEICEMHLKVLTTRGTIIIGATTE